MVEALEQVRLTLEAVVAVVRLVSLADLVGEFAHSPAVRTVERPAALDLLAHIARDPLDPAYDLELVVTRLRARRTELKRALLDQTLGSGWRLDLDQLKGLRERKADPAFRQSFMAIKRANKQRLAALIEKRTGIVVDRVELNQKRIDDAVFARPKG